MSAVSEIMSEKNVLSVKIDSNKNIFEISKLMIKNNVGSVLFIDAHNKPMGIITERDIIKKVGAKNLKPDNVKCEEIMSSPVITIMAYDSIDTAAKKMKENKIKRLPVIEENNRIVGIISTTDIIKHLSKIMLDDYNRVRSLNSFLNID